MYRKRHPNQLANITTPEGFRSLTGLEKALVGKVVAQANFHSNRISIRFEDGTFIFGLAKRDSWSGDDECEVDWDEQPDTDDLRDVGVISQEEADARNKEDADEKIARKREQLERLKRELGES